MALATQAQTAYAILGIGQNAAQAFTPYTTSIHGEHIAIIAATQVIDSDLQSAWTATATQPGLASAYDVNDLVAAVEAARKTADTVIVYLHWGTELDACPNPLQEPLAQVLVQAGADIIVGTHAHVLLGGGYLGSAYVDYGLGNFAFYDNSPPENASGSLVITATGRHIDQITWRPAVIVDDLPQPLTGAAAAAALAAWDQARACTNVSVSPGACRSPRCRARRRPPRPRRRSSSRSTRARQVPMVRPESWTRPVGASPTRVKAGKPGSRPRFVAERRRAERGVKSLFGGSKCAGRSAERRESCSLVTVTTREPSRSCHGEGSIRPTGVPDMPMVESLRGMGSGTCTRSGSEQERPVFPALSAKTARISQW